MRIFVTGGAGYIGSHTVLQLLKGEHDVFVFDNFSSGSLEALERVRKMADREFEIGEGDIRSLDDLTKAMASFSPDAVVHFAGLKSVTESTELPLEYYNCNVSGSVNLLMAMNKVGCKRLIFSSSANIYGFPKAIPIPESHPISPTNAYGKTKYFIEEMIRDWVASGTELSAVLLRYFNPVGADPSGMIGEDPKGIPNNLLPYITQVALGKRDKLTVYGGDYETRDGTGERDFIHIEDLASAHIAALDYAAEHVGCEAINVGTGRGFTVLELVKAFEAATGVSIPYSISDRRVGDAGRSVAGVDRASELLKWQARHGIESICETAWRWQKNNPEGFTS